MIEPPKSSTSKPRHPVSIEAVHEAASIVCHRIAQCGWDSTEARDAYAAWTSVWLAWRAGERA